MITAKFILISLVVVGFLFCLYYCCFSQGNMLYRKHSIIYQ